MDQNIQNDFEGLAAFALALRLKQKNSTNYNTLQYYFESSMIR